MNEQVSEKKSQLSIFEQKNKYFIYIPHIVNPVCYTVNKPLKF